MPLGPQTPVLSPDLLPSITVHPRNPLCSPVSIPASSLLNGPHSAPSHPLYPYLWAGLEACLVPSCSRRQGHAQATGSAMAGPAA